ncbi:hypothetical protein CYMTET_9754 [Cymbomonas tetramitiformis]|uniref:F-box domain-containing protein n=1 Tax=Cymbomonas tetramitiformis TaxID=36881 RepID=A0AAE0LET9_9CHLO|nr:hypothetical protein CYMTET_9754 [Cymbomonas tetramitiformis]
MNELLRQRVLLQRLENGQVALQKDLETLRVSRESLTASTAPSPAEEDTSVVRQVSLLDLDESLLMHVLVLFDNARDLCALTQTCTALKRLVTSEDAWHFLWRPMCVLHWGVVSAEAEDVPCLEEGLPVTDFYMEEVMEDLANQYANGDSWDGGCAGQGGWRAVYRDRLLGWRRGLTMLSWLKEHHHPSEVAGRRHRYDLYIAIFYLGLCTGYTGEAPG